MYIRLDQNGHQIVEDVDGFGDRANRRVDLSGNRVDLSGNRIQSSGNDLSGNRINLI